MQKKKVFGFILMLIAVIAISFGGKVTHAAGTPMLMERETSTYISGSSNVYYAIGASRSNNTKYTADLISTITFVTNKNVPDTAEASWDASYTSGDGEVIAWVILNSEDSTKYDLYIGADGETIEAPENSEGLLGNYELCNAINNLSMLDTSKATTMKYMFYYCKNLKKLDLSNFDTSKVTNMYSMFNWCSSLTSLNVSNFDTSKVTNMYSMFCQCNNLTNLDLSNFNTSKVYDMGAMFNSCSSLISVNVSGLDTSNVSNMNFMFYSCNGLTSLDLSDFDTSSASNISYMLLGCSNLKTIILDKSITDSSQVIRLGERVMQTPAFIYVADTISEKVYEESPFYVAVYGSGKAAYKIRPILEVVGKNPVKIGVSETYDETDDSGVTIAGFTKANASEYERYGYSYTTSGLPVDTSTVGKKQVIYTLTKTSNGTTTNRMTAIRTVNVSENTTITYDANGGVFSNGNTQNVVTYTGSLSVISGTYNEPTTTVENMKFGGWYTDADCTDGNEFDLYECLSSVTVYAKYVEDLVASGTTGEVSWKIYKNGSMKIYPTNGVSGTMNSLTGSSSGAPWYNYRTSVKSVIVEDGVNTNKNVSYMFYGFSNCVSMDLSGLNTTSATNMSYMFSSCSKLAALDVSEFDTSSVTSMSSMFSSCSSLTNLNLSNFDTSKITNMSQMFYGCSKLTNINLTEFDTSNVTNMSNMFYNCSKLTAIILDKSITSSDEAMKLLTGTSLDSLSNAILYVPDVASEKLYEQATNYSTQFKHDKDTEDDLYRIRPILEVFGKNPTRVFVSGNYDKTSDAGATIAGFNKANASEYEQYGYSYTTSGLPLDTSKEGTKEIVYTLTKTQNGITTSGMSVTRNVSIVAPISTTYDANGGTFANGMTRNVVKYGEPIIEESITKISKTSNVSSDGSTYTGGYGDNKTITDKITIPGATELKVTITYATESTSYDWVCVYDSSVTPSASNYSSSISGKLGGTTKTTKTYTIEGDTVQFFFRSDSSSSSFYGYYAVVEGTKESLSITSGSYEEPVSNTKNMKFSGWYTDADCTDGNEFDLANITTPIAVYAKYIEDLIASGITGEVSWKIYRSGLLKIYPTNGVSGTMNSLSGSSSSAPWYSYRTSITSVIVEDGVSTNNNVSYMFYGFSNCVSMSLTGLNTTNATSMSSMFSGCSKLTAIILDKSITSSDEAMKLLTGTSLDSLSNAILYVPDAASEKLYEKATNYGTIFKNSKDTSNDLYRIRPILELVGDSSVKIKINEVYDADIDRGVTIAGFDKTNASEYEQYGYSYTTSGLPVDTSIGGTKEIAYTLTKTQNETIKNGMTVVRNINVVAPVTIIYDANGGTFTNGATQNVVVYSEPPTKESVTKISKTSNVSSDGSTYTGDYGNNKATTDKITFPGATELKVTITYATENTSYDWVCVYDGSVTPSASNYSSSISGKLGGTTRTTKTYTITGDTAQFFFRSDSAESSYYGYYAVVEGTKENISITSGTYEEPASSTKYMNFDGWYTDSTCTDGNEFDLYNNTSSITVYAKYVEDLIDSGVTGGISWKIYRNGLLRIYPTNGVSGTMNSLSGSTSGAPWYNHRTSVTSVIVENGVNTNQNVAYMFYELSNCVSMDLSGLSTANATNMNYMFSSCSKLTALDVSKFDTSNVISMSYMFYTCKNLSSLDVSNFNTANVTSMNSMFSSCSNLTSLNVDGFNTSNVTNMSSIFASCSSLTNLNISGFNTSSVTNMSSMFSSCSRLTSLDVSNFNTAKVTNMGSMFSSCSSLSSLNVSNFNTAKVIEMGNMFSSCSRLTSLDVSNFNTAKVTNMGNMFSGCSGLSELNLSNFDTSNVIYMYNMFSSCSGLTNLNLSGFNTSNVTIMYGVFESCSKLTNLNLSNFDTSSVTVMGRMFYNCTGLANLDLSNFDTAKVTDMTSMFQNCSNLKSLNLSSFAMLSNTNASGFLAGCSNLVSINISNFATAKDGGMFYGCTSLKAIILDKKITSSSEAMQIASGIYLDTLPNAILYVPDTESEKLYEQATNYSTIFKDSRDTNGDLYRIRPMLELIGDTQVNVKQGETYNESIDKGVTIAGFDKTNVSEYSKYGYNYTVTGLPVDTTTGGIKQVKYTLTKTQNGTTTNGMTVIRNVEVITTITYNANGGVFSNGYTINVVSYSGLLTKKNITKISKTSNVSENGSTYTGGYGDNKAITDKITIPGATELKVTITYATESTSYDWVCVYNGSVTPSADNYSSSISGKLGGNSKTTKTYTIPGDTVQFFFRSDGSSSDYYGYYAVVEAEKNEMAIMSGTYEEPTTTAENMKFGGWYTDTTCTDGNEFDLYNNTSSITVYAKYVEDLIDSGVTGGVSWKIYRSGLLKIYPTNGVSGTMNSLTGWSSGAPWYNYRTSVTSVVVENGVSTNRNIAYMFNGLSNCVLMDLSELNVTNAVDTSYMFYDCRSLLRLDVTKFNTSSVTNMRSMFDSCESLTSLDVTKFDTSSVTNMYSMFDSCKSLTNLDVTKFDTSNVTNMIRMFSSCSSLTNLNVTNFNTSNVTNMSSMFSSCSSLTSLDVSNFNTAKVTDMGGMFSSCSSLTNLNVTNFNTSNVTSMGNMFSYCRRLMNLDLSSLDTSKVTSMYSMFSSCSSLTSLDVSNFDTAKVINMRGMFSSCSSLTNLNVTNFNTSNVTNMSSMFSSCSSLTSLDVSNFNTAKVTDMGGMFSSCSSLTNLNVTNFNTSNVTSMGNMFSYCRRLMNLDLSSLDTSKVTNMGSMFLYCGNLTSLDLSNFNTSKVTNMNGMFYDCTKLTAIILDKSITSSDQAMKLLSGTKLDNLPNVIIYVPDEASEKLYEQATNYATILKDSRDTNGDLYRVRPLLEVAGDNPTVIAVGRPYNVSIDKGATVAGFDKDNASEYTKYGYNYITSGLPLDTSSIGTKQISYTLTRTESGTTTNGMTVTRDIEIGIKSFANLSVSLPQEKYGYIGEEIKPEPIVKDGDQVLIKGTEYDISYRNNINIGIATIIITAKGGYTGTKETTFEIITGTMSGRVNIKGVNKVGSTLTVDTSEIIPNGCGLSYQWYVSSEILAQNGTAINGAKNESYVVTSNDVGKYIYVEVTASKKNYTTEKFVDITDAQNNKYAIAVDNIDRKPTIRFSQKLTDDGAVEITAIIKAVNGVARISVNNSTINSSEYQNSIRKDNYEITITLTYTAYINGKYVFEVEDKEGNITQEVENVSILGTLNPVITYKKYNATYYSDARIEFESSVPVRITSPDSYTADGITFSTKYYSTKITATIAKGKEFNTDKVFAFTNEKSEQIDVTVEAPIFTDNVSIRMIKEAVTSMNVTIKEAYALSENMKSNKVMLGKKVDSYYGINSDTKVGVATGNELNLAQVLGNSSKTSSLNSYGKIEDTPSTSIKANANSNYMNKNATGVYKKTDGLLDVLMLTMSSLEKYNTFRITIRP